MFFDFNNLEKSFEASFLDRYGYVKFQIIPIVGSVDVDSSDAEFRKLVEEGLSMYKPNIGTSYASYKVGDKVSEYGVLGVLAALAGVKWGKAAATGIFAILLIFAKKLWWVIFIPIIYIFRGIFRKK